MVDVGFWVILSHFDTKRNRTAPTEPKNEIMTKNIFFRTAIVINVIQLHFQHARTIELGDYSRTKTVALATRF